MIDFTICETFDCVGFDLTFTGELSYTYTKDKMVNEVNVDLHEVLLEITNTLIDIKSSLPKYLLITLQEELENYFWKSTYWEDKYLDAITK